MYTIYNEKTKYPIKLWLRDGELPEESCMEQAYRLANLPFIHKWVCLMPDTHTGMGMPIGGVIATEGAVIPNAVGNDIGCGMAFVHTNISAELARSVQTGNGTLLQAVVGEIMRNVPLGFKHHKVKQESTSLDCATANPELYEPDAGLIPEIEAAYCQIGTLGGGNHFIEIQEDEDGYMGLMLHSGSRHFGSQICRYFNNMAKELNEKWNSDIPYEKGLAFLPLDSHEGKQYMNWMNLALNFARENRSKMLEQVKNVFKKLVEKHMDINVEFTEEVNCHHNYASMENHYGKNVLVHRKGAARAREGEPVLIPGAMGSYSYVVQGKGNPESFFSSSHGAGRKYSRKGAMQAFSTEEVMNDLKEKQIILGKHKKNDVAEESRFAYKDIDEVMADQKDLVEPILKLKTVGVIRG